MGEIEVEEFYKKQARDLTNLLFDKGFLDSNLTREAIGWLEDYIGFILQSHCQIAAKSAVVLAKYKEKGETP